MNVAEQVPPQAPEAEEAVLGAMLYGRRTVERVLGTELLPDDFYRTSHATLYSALVGIYVAGDEPDPLVAIDHLERQGKLEEVGGRNRIRELASLVPTGSNVAHYAGMIRDTAQRRRIIRSFGEVLRRAWEGGDAEEILSFAEEQMISLRSRATGTRSHIVTGAELVRRIEERWRNPEQAYEGAGYSTPWPELLGTFLPGSLYVIPGRTGQGKSVFAIQSLRSIAEENVSVGFVSLEMTVEQVGDRLLSTYGIPYEQVRSGKISPAYEDRFKAALGEVGKVAGNFEVVDNTSLDAAGIITLTRMRGYDAVIVDHLHQIVPEGRTDDYRLEIEKQIRLLAFLARDRNIPVIVLAQLRKSGVGVWNPRPTLGDVRETDVIEQLAAVVCAPWLDYDKKTRTTTGDAELIVTKNRFGATGKVLMTFVEDCVYFKPRPGAESLIRDPRSERIEGAPRADLSVASEEPESATDADGIPLAWSDGNDGREQA